MLGVASSGASTCSPSGLRSTSSSTRASIGRAPAGLRLPGAKMPTGWMSDVEALMWNVQRDPFLDPTFGSLSVLDAMPDVDHVRGRLLRMVDRNPRFGQHVVAPVGRLTNPAW